MARSTEVKPKALLFDLDGTLADTAEANYRAYAQALREVGVSVERQAFDRVAFGRNWRQFLPELLHEAGNSADAAALAARKRDIYPDLLRHVPLNQPLIGLLRAARPGFRTGLVTTASGANADAFLDLHGLRALFDIVITGDDVSLHKPDPEAYMLAAERLELMPGECMAFEDSDIGVASATAAGVPVIRVVLA